MSVRGWESWGREFFFGNWGRKEEILLYCENLVRIESVAWDCFFDERGLRARVSDDGSVVYGDA